MITHDEIIRDRLVFGIRDEKTRERLLRESGLTLECTDEICHAAESMVSQMKLVQDSQAVTVSALVSSKETRPTEASPVSKWTQECWNCWRRHEFHKEELCPAYGKKHRKPNHIAAKCRSQGMSSFVR